MILRAFELYVTAEARRLKVKSITNGEGWDLWGSRGQAHLVYSPYCAVGHLAPSKSLTLSGPVPFAVKSAHSHHRAAADVPRQASAQLSICRVDTEEQWVLLGEFLTRSL